MDDKTVLHTAARRFCQERFSEWANAYNDLGASGSDRVEHWFKPAWDHSKEAYRIFPRYRLHAAIQAEVERLETHEKESVAAAF